MVLDFEVSAPVLILFYTAHKALGCATTAALASSLRFGHRQHVVQTRRLKPGEAARLYLSGNDSEDVRSATQ
jgi:hypothetical protein